MAVTSHRSRYIRLEELEVKLHGISHIRNDQISRLLSENFQTEQSRGAVRFREDVFLSVVNFIIVITMISCQVINIIWWYSKMTWYAQSHTWTVVTMARIKRSQTKVKLNSRSFSLTRHGWRIEPAVHPYQLGRLYTLLFDSKRTVTIQVVQKCQRLMVKLLLDDYALKVFDKLKKVWVN